MFSQFKMYFLIGAVLAVAIGSWSARGWYEDGKVVTALELQKKAFELQQDKDAVALASALDKEANIRLAYRSLHEQANKTKLCTNGGNDFLRVFNRGAIAANTTK